MTTFLKKYAETSVAKNVYSTSYFINVLLFYQYKVVVIVVFDTVVRTINHDCSLGGATVALDASSLL